MDSLASLTDALLHCTRAGHLGPGISASARQSGTIPPGPCRGGHFSYSAGRVMVLVGLPPPLLPPPPPLSLSLTPHHPVCPCLPRLSLSPPSVIVSRACHCLPIVSPVCPCLPRVSLSPHRLHRLSLSPPLSLSPALVIVSPLSPPCIIVSPACVIVSPLSPPSVIVSPLAPPLTLSPLVFTQSIVYSVQAR